MSLGPTPLVSDSVDVRLGIFNKFSGDAEAAGPATTLRESLP